MISNTTDNAIPKMKSHSAIRPIFLTPITCIAVAPHRITIISAKRTIGVVLNHGVPSVIDKAPIMTYIMVSIPTVMWIH